MTATRAITEKCPLTPSQQMLASCSGAMITSLFVTPLDVVKIRLQAQQKALLSNKCFLYCNGLMDHLCGCFNGQGTNPSSWVRSSVHFNGTVDAFVKIVQVEGLSSLWSGLPPTLVMAVPSTVIYFTAYEQLRSALTKRIAPEHHVPIVPLIAGSTARLIAASLISPLELIRTKMQSKRLTYRQVGMAIRQLVNHTGYLSLWRGFVPSMLRDVPFSAIYWTSYEFLKARHPREEADFGYTFAAGAISGTIAAVMTLPFDVVKTHRQIELGEKEVFSDPPQRSAKTMEILRRIYRQSGYKALFTGIVPRVVKVAPACAIMISSYEYGKAFFRHYNECELDKKVNGGSPQIDEPLTGVILK